MKTTALLLAFFLAPAAAFAGRIRIDPPAPDSKAAVAITVGGVWNSGCVPRNAVATVSGSVITIVLDAVVTGGCTANVPPWEATVNLGSLAPGAYEVRA